MSSRRPPQRPAIDHIRLLELGVEAKDTIPHQGYRIWILLWPSCRYTGFQKPYCGCIRSRITNSVVAVR